MDADYTKRRRESEKSRREKRWSMNSQRLEEIVAELMRPISDIRRSFDTDLSALLEEYLTEAVRRALDADEAGAGGAAGAGGGGAAGGAPNFTEAALLLQQAACTYCRKVDYLYQHVLSLSEAQHASQEGGEAGAGAEGAATPSARRKRKASAADALAQGFVPLDVQTSASARREVSAPRPPPTLPRMYMELEPRVMAAADAPLLDYALEPIGLLDDFQVTWRLQDGLLVDDLEGGGGSRTSLRAVPLTELQAAIEAAAPPSPPALASPAPALASPAPALTSPAPAAPAPVACSTPLAKLVKKERKRRHAVDLEELVDGKINFIISPELVGRLQQQAEFSVPPPWVSRVVAARKLRVLAERRRLRDADYKRPKLSSEDICGLDINHPVYIEGFRGWAAAEAAAAAAAAGAAAKRVRRADDSDDDGFFEQSSLGDSDDSAHNHLTATATATATNTSLADLTTRSGDCVDGEKTVNNSTLASSAEWVAWRDGVVARAAAAEARGFADVRAAAASLLASVRALPAATPTVDSVLAATVEHPTDVSRVFLATLFLANAGNLEIVPGPPLTVNTFSVRYVSADERLYSAAVADTPLAR